MSLKDTKAQPIALTRAIFHEVAPPRTRVPSWIARGKSDEPAPKAARGSPRPSDTPSALRPSGRPPRPSSRAPMESRGNAEPGYTDHFQAERLAADMRDSARARATEEAQTAIVAEISAHLEREIGALHDARRRMLGALESSTLALVRAVSERVLAREIARDDGALLRLVREGIASLEDTDTVSIVLGPAFDTEGSVLAAALEQQGIRATVSIDDEASLYACSIRTSFGSVDESMDARLDAVMAALEGHEEGTT